jgi:hypothetical protein
MRGTGEQVLDPAITLPDCRKGIGTSFKRKWVGAGEGVTAFSPAVSGGPTTPHLHLWIAILPWSFIITSTVANNPKIFSKMKSSGERYAGWPLIIGIVVGVLALTAGPALAALTFSGASIIGDGAIVIDGPSTISIGTSTATGVTIGNGSSTTYFPGNVGIGTTTPSRLLSVNGDAAITGKLYLSRFGDAIKFGQSGTANDGGIGDGGSGDFYIYNAGSGDLELEQSGPGNLDLDANANASSNITFHTSNGYDIIDANGDLGIGNPTPQAPLDVNGTTTILEQSLTPAYSTSTCTTGMFAWDSNYFYECVGTNTWKRAALSSW